jgi:transcription elongation factor GreA
MELKTTPGGYSRLHQLWIDTRARFYEVCQDNEDANGSGDSSVWHDNFAYEENQRQMHALSTKVITLERLLADLNVTGIPMEKPTKVVLGSFVKVLMNEKEQEFFICGHQDGDLHHGRISYDSPLGKALLGLEIEDDVVVELGGKQVEVEIVSIGLSSQPEHN